MAASGLLHSAGTSRPDTVSPRNPMTLADHIAGPASPDTAEVANQLQRLREQLRDVQRQDQLLQRQTKARLRLLTAIEQKQRLLEEKRQAANMVETREKLERESVRECVQRERKRKARQQQQLERDFTEHMKVMEQTRAEHQLEVQRRRLPDNTLHQLVAEERQILKESVAESRRHHTEALQSNRQEQQESRRQRIALLRANEEEITQHLARQAISQQQLHREHMVAMATNKFEGREALRKAELQAKLKREEEELKRVERLAQTTLAVAQERRAQADGRKAALRRVDEVLEKHALGVS
eukprot:GGOE01036602.1.p1 GENE.GGOE01036602.1~~GGOE01036602.1.p1  ORF type:complete len:331 (-),score=117.73 GGOE01036602.1:313-1206(-)